MIQTWLVFTTLTLMVVQSCIGDKSCTIWSSAGELVQRDTTFEVFCTFRCRCRGSMYSDHPPTLQRHTELNDTTIYFKVVNITKNRTYSCNCNCPPAQDPCGLDIFAGYSPDRPENLTCNYTVFNNESGDVLCTWNRGRHTYLSDTTVLWLRTVSEYVRSKAQPHRVSVSQESYSQTVPRSVQLIYVWVQVHNDLGSALTPPINYTLTDIAAPSPPFLVRSACQSRECVLTMEQPVLAQQLQIQSEAAQQTGTRSYSGQSLQMSTVLTQFVSSLEPNTLYHFKARSRFNTGVWSEWSSSISSWTQEEAPAEMLDLWFAESDSKSPRVYWKELDVSMARGKIRGYRVRVHNPVTGLDLVTNFTGDTRNYSVPTCDSCEVTVWAHNSEGSSPPATITPLHSKAKSSQDVQVTAGRHNITLFWPKPETAVVSYVVEWYPEGEKLEELRWLRMEGSDDHVVIAEIEPLECYEGAVYVFGDGASVHRKVFSGVSISESAPEAAPLLQETVERDTVRVSWSDLPRTKRRGCITNYTIYLKNVGGHKRQYSASASERSYLIRHLSPGNYDLWMTASTAEGEGPASHKQRFPIQEGTLLINLLLLGVFSLLVVAMCVCLFSDINQKLRVLFHCLMLDVVPDPANSKWAKEYVNEKGEMNFQLQLGNSSSSEEEEEEEEEPILVDVEELTRESKGNPTTHVSTQLHSQTSLSSEAAPSYPVSTYVQSLSQDSNSPEHTHTSQGTETTVEYITSHGLGDMEEDQEEEEEEEEQGLSFFPIHNVVFVGSMGFGGKLTLDGVKVDLCRDFFQEQHEATNY